MTGFGIFRTLLGKGVNNDDITDSTTDDDNDGDDEMIMKITL